MHTRYKYSYNIVNNINTVAIGDHITCNYACILIVFGPPRVTLNCSADYVTLKKIVEVSWKPTLVINETFNATFDDRIQDCKANITCNVNKTEVSLIA